jgi:hypothetical protein
MASEVDLPADDGALERLLRERRFGPTAPNEVTPWDFVFAWPQAALRTRVWPIVSRLLVDGDALVRVRALELVRRWDAGQDLAVPRLLDAVEQHLDLFKGPIVEGIAMADAAAHALCNRIGVDRSRIVAQLRRLSGGTPLGGGAAAVLGEYDPTFAIQVAQHAGEGAIDWIDEAARSVALFRRDHVRELLTALRKLSPGSRARLVATVEQYLQRDDAKAAAIARAEGLPAPTAAAPTAAECRAAIGL